MFIIVRVLLLYSSLVLSFVLSLIIHSSTLFPIIASLLLLSSTSILNTQYVNIIDSNNQQSFNRELLPNSFGAGWSLSPNPGISQTSQTTEEYWVEVQLNERYKLQAIWLQQKIGSSGSGKYWIKYGLGSNDSLVDYQWDNQTKVCFNSDFKHSHGGGLYCCLHIQIS